MKNSYQNAIEAVYDKINAKQFKEFKKVKLPVIPYIGEKRQKFNVGDFAKTQNVPMSNIIVFITEVKFDNCNGKFYYYAVEVNNESRKYKSCVS